MALWLWVFMVLAFLVAIFGVLFLLAGLAHSRWWSQLWRIALGGGLLAVGRVGGLRHAVDSSVPVASGS